MPKPAAPSACARAREALAPEESRSVERVLGSDPVDVQHFRGNQISSTRRTRSRRRRYSMASPLRPQTSGGGRHLSVRALPLVLVIDDSSDALEVYDIALRLEGFAVEGARDGREGFRKAVELQPDLIITDLAMPVMNGWETIRELRADDRTRRIPIIACSGGNESPEMQDVWVDAVLTKPCPLQVLLQEVRRLLRRSSAA
jgi:CheY-like chemotaxis protein